MRTSSAYASIAVIALGLSLGPVAAFDGSKAPDDALSPMEAFRDGTIALKAGEKQKGLSALEYAAEKGHPQAQWQLGRMYATGDMVAHDDLRAFDYFSRIINKHAEDNPRGPEWQIVANAFVALGRYYLTGIPNTRVTADPTRAREMFFYAASYFGDADAQYNLARLYLSGTGAPRDPWQAARWLGLAANKGQHQAQAMLGSMLFRGDQLPRQAAQGLMWLTLARDGASATEGWIVDLYDSAFKQATADERELGFHYLERWMKHRRE
jgi:TPR repeat protein